MDTVSMLNKMSFYCQPILPLVYDESMSYYETLCKVVGQLNTTGDAVNKLNEGLTDEIAGRQEADRRLNERLTSEIDGRHEAERLLNERLKAVEATNKKIHFLAFAGTPPHNARPVGDMPTRSELRQWINDRDMIITVMETTDEEHNVVYATSCTYNAVNWTHESPTGFYIIVPISIDYDSEGNNAVRQKIAKITIPPGSDSSLDGDWGLQFIEINTPFTGGKIEGNVEITGFLNVGMSAEFSSSINAGSEITSDMLLMAPIVALRDPATEKSISFGVSGENAAKVTSPVSGGGTQYARLAVGTPTGDNDAATKKYVDDHAGGGNSDFIINATKNEDEPVVLDKTFAQIKEAVQSGKRAIVQMTSDGKVTIMPLISNQSRILLFSSLYNTDGQIFGVSLIVTSSGVIDYFISTPTNNPDGTMPQVSMAAAPTMDMQIATKKYVDDHAGGGSSVTVDTVMSDTSTNAVQNKVIKKYVDDHGAANAVLYTTQSLTFEQKQQARKNIQAADSVWPTITGGVSLCPENITDSNDAAHVKTTRTSADDYTVTVDGGPENQPVRVKGIRTPTDTDNDAAANVEYVKKYVDDALAAIGNGNEVSY